MACRGGRCRAAICSISPTTRRLPLVATNEVLFRQRADYEAHDALLCIAEGATSSRTTAAALTPEHYFKSAAEMAALFADLPEALDNTVEIAVRCAFRPEPRKPILPRFVRATTSLSEIENVRGSRPPS